MHNTIACDADLVSSALYTISPSRKYHSNQNGASCRRTMMVHKVHQFIGTPYHGNLCIR